MGSGSEMRVSGGWGLNFTWTYVPGGAGGRRVQRVPPTRVGLPGKPRASRNGGWRGTQRGARSPRGGRSIPIRSTYPGGTLGIVDGWATRTGQRGSALAVRPESGVGGGVYINIIHIDITFPAAGDRGKKEPGCRRPTGPALRPVNKHGVSGKPGWGVSSQAPEGNRREWHRRGGLRAETPGRAHSSGQYMGVRYPLWGTGREPTGTARQPLAPLTELQEPRRVGSAGYRNRGGGL